MRKTGSVIAKIMLVIFIVLTLGFGSYAGFRLFTGGKESDLPEKNVKRNYVVLADPAVVPSASEAEVNAASSYDVKMNGLSETEKHIRKMLLSKILFQTLTVCIST